MRVSRPLCRRFYVSHTLPVSSCLLHSRRSHALGFALFPTSRTNINSQDTDDEETSLRFPDIPSVKEEETEERPQTPTQPPPEPENPLPEDLPDNHPKEEPTRPYKPEIEPMPRQPDEPLRSPPEMPIPSVPQESPPISPTEYSGSGSAPNEFEVPHPQEWTPP